MANRNGRRPLPTALKIAEGNRSKTKLEPEKEPQFATSTNRPPYLTGEAAAEWDRVYGFLTEQKILTVADETALAFYCTLFSRWRQNEKQLELEQLAIETEKGTIYQNPLVGISNTLMEHMRKILIEFGMTPASRAKLASGKDNDPGAELKKFMERKTKQKERSKEKMDERTKPEVSDFDC